MAVMSPEYLLVSPQEHIPSCKEHNLTLDITCEKCDEFICSTCAKTDHKDHNWKTIPTAGNLRRRELKKTLRRTKEEEVAEIDKMIEKTSKQMEDNRICCDSEVSKLHKQFDAMDTKLKEIKKSYKKILRENQKRKHDEVKKKKKDLEKKKTQVMDLVEFLEEKYSTMSDYSLIDNLRDLSSIVSNCDCDLEKMAHSVRYRRGDINDRLLESMMGQTFDLDDFTVTDTDSLQYCNNQIVTMEAVNEDTCFVEGLDSDCIEKINIKNETGTKLSRNVNDICVTDNADVYATAFNNRSVIRLSSSDSFSKVFSTAPLMPIGICQSIEGQLLVSLMDTDSERYQPNSGSKRLVRHVTLTGDIIREYEYQDGNQTRLFTLPRRVKQNANGNICVVNVKSDTTGELVILSVSGSLKSVYCGQNLVNEFSPVDVVFDTHCNILVSDIFNSKIHLLSPDGEFMKYLLTENEVTDPCCMSLHKPTLWVGNRYGLVKVFRFKRI